MASSLGASSGVAMPAAIFTAPSAETEPARWVAGMVTFIGRQDRDSTASDDGRLPPPAPIHWRGTGVSYVTIRVSFFHLSWSRSSVREFRDVAGIQWSVFRATPHTSPAKREKILPETYRFGWLVFECETERRRLAPVPENWEGLTERELEHLCTVADVVPARNQRRATSREEATTVNTPAPTDVREPAGARDVMSARAARMQELLAKVIDDVCDQPPAHSLDTGELIRVEETLAIAAHAAKEAVALRRAAGEELR